MAEYRLRILHLSDLHERAVTAETPAERRRAIELAAASRYRVLESGSLAETLREIAADYPIDLVCFTGDAADWGLPEEYRPATERLDALLAAAGCGLRGGRGRGRLPRVSGRRDGGRALLGFRAKEHRLILADNRLLLGDRFAQRGVFGLQGGDPCLQRLEALQQGGDVMVGDGWCNGHP